MYSYISFFEDLDIGSIRRAGGKGANLGHLTRAGYLVPPGFAVTAEAFDLLMEKNGLEPRIRAELETVDFDDRESVDGATARVRAMIEAAPVPAGVESDIRRGYRELLQRAGEGARVAVRSSVGSRDLSRSSFPGQMDTYHNVAGEDEVVRLVRCCWASVFSYRATVSRQAGGIDHFDVFIAPLVQVMVPAETAGVIFSANPLNNRADQVVINACLGLGEGVVSGEVSADHYVLDKETLSVLEENIGRKRIKFIGDESSRSGTRRVEVPEEEAELPCLDEEQVQKLARLAVEIEELYGRPQDIEWAYHGGSLYVLQSRAITTIKGAPVKEPTEWVSEFDTRVDPRYPCYTLSNISEVLCGVLSPLTISGLDHLDYGFIKTNTDFGLMKGIEPDSEYVFLGIFYGRAHLNLSVVKALTAKLPGASAQEFERMLPEGEGDGDTERFKPTPRALLGLISPMFRISYKMFSTPREVKKVRRRLERRLAVSRVKDFEVMPYQEVLEWMEESRRYRQEIIALHITASQFAVVFHDFLRKLTARWLGDEHGSLASRLVTGLQNIESAGPALGIWDLSRMVLESERLRDVFRKSEPGEIMGALQGGGCDEERFLSALKDFLLRFGYRSVFEAELMLPNWDDDPSFVFAMIQNYLDTDPAFNPRELARRQQGEREAAYRQALSMLGGPRRWLFRFLLGQAQRYIALREYTKATLITGIAQIKKELHALSRRFAREGVVKEPGDMFFLTMEEVQALAAGGGADLDVPSLVSRRREEYERNRKVVLPEYSRGRPRPLTGSDLERSGEVEVLEGIAVSPGRVTGPARVITDPRSRARIEPGEILVAPVTDAAWTPLFVTAAAIVVDVGGPLSHGSIVAREYGIPGVLNVGVATRIIRDGQVLTVDGDRGKVYIHDAEARLAVGRADVQGKARPGRKA